MIVTREQLLREFRERPFHRIERIRPAGQDPLLLIAIGVTISLAAALWWDEGRLADRVLPWLQRARSRGVEVLVGAPGRRYLPVDELVELASYEVRTTTGFVTDISHVALHGTCAACSAWVVPPARCA